MGKAQNDQLRQAFINNIANLPLEERTLEVLNIIESIRDVATDPLTKKIMDSLYREVFNIVNPTQPKVRKVVCAANRNAAGKIVAGARHWDSVMRGMCVVDGSLPPEWLGADQGFIDQYGVWMTREEAYEVAAAAGQLAYASPTTVGVLYSEDLY